MRLDGHVSDAVDPAIGQLTNMEATSDSEVRKKPLRHHLGTHTAHNRFPKMKESEEEFSNGWSFNVLIFVCQISDNDYVEH